MSGKYCDECGYDRLDPTNYDAASPRKCSVCGVSLLPRPLPPRSDREPYEPWGEEGLPHEP